MAAGSTKEPAVAKPTGTRGFVGVVGLLAVLSAATGAFYQHFINAPSPRNTVEAASEPAKPHTEQGTSKMKKEAERNNAAASQVQVPKEDKGELVSLDPVLVNLEPSGRRWLRIEASILVGSDAKGDRSTLARVITQDILLRLRNASVAQFESASALEFLRDDLLEIARIRSNGAVKKLLLRSLVIE